jgi:formiminotetrahydrofolate cyclodeaminase
MYKDLTIESFISEVNSNSPAPGGGSVSALSQALGMSLFRMYQHLTISKKKYVEMDTELKDTFESVFEMIEGNLNELLIYIDKDTEAFNELMKCFKMPKETDEEKLARSTEIQNKTIDIIEVPLKVASIGYEVLKGIETVIDHGNKNAITDAGCGVLMIYAGIEGALLNVLVNLGSLKDLDKKAKYETEMNRILEGAKKSRDLNLQKVYNYL